MRLLGDSVIAKALAVFSRPYPTGGTYPGHPPGMDWLLLSWHQHGLQSTAKAGLSAFLES